LDETVARLEHTFGAMGARWRINTERSFRDALAAILEKSFGVVVINVNEFDDEGTVFGQPEQVELDVVIHNGTLILIEIKSSINTSIYVFERKVRFYERRHEHKAQRLIVISPMINPRAREIGNKQLGMDLYANSMDVSTQ